MIYFLKLYGYIYNTLQHDTLIQLQQQKAQQTNNGHDDTPISGAPIIRPGTYKKSDVPMLR